MRRMTVQTTTQGATELNGVAKWMHKQAQTVEERWRTAHGLDDKLRTKHQRKAKPERQPLERGEIRRREERQQRHIDHVRLRKPLLRGIQ
jgi:hypothetical protein